MSRHLSHKHQNQQAQHGVQKELVEASETGASLEERCVSIGFVAEIARSVHAGQSPPVRSGSVGTAERTCSANFAKAATQQQTQDDQTRLHTWIFNMKTNLKEVWGQHFCSQSAVGITELHFVSILNAQE